MISVIVPVYNVEPYLRKCLDNVINQTYRDLEILIVDDGSTDDSGRICDEYAEQDERVRVFHTENRGLSCARNLGLDEAQGEWIGFVDSDDWIELDMYECLLSRALETGADVVECEHYKEFDRKTIPVKKQEQLMTGMEAVRALLKRKLINAVWNKLYKRQCFEGIRYPEGRVFEDIATTYRVFADSDLVSTIASPKYHYRWRTDGLAETRHLENLEGCWISNMERYEYLKDKLKEDSYRDLLRTCAEAVARTWENYYGCDKKERDALQKVIDEMRTFTKQSIPLFGYPQWSLITRMRTVIIHSANPLSFGISYVLNGIYKAVRYGMLRIRNS